MNDRRVADTQRGRRVLGVRLPATTAAVETFLGRLAGALAGDGPVLAPLPPDGADAARPADHADDEPVIPSPPAVPPAPSDSHESDGALRDTLDAALDDPSDPTALLVATSGSTGAARHVALQASALLASASATHDRLGGPGRWLLALPPHHVAGLQVLVRSLVGRTVPTVLDPSGFTAERFAAAAELHLARGQAAQGGRSYVSLVPTQLHRILRSGGPAVGLLARFDAVLVGGAALPPHLAEQARTAGVRLVSTYGMTETCGGCVYDGVPLDGVRVRIEGPDPDGVGRVVLSGPVLARGYLDPAPPAPSDAPGKIPDDPAGLVTAAGTRLLVTGELVTSDVGHWDGARLRIVGRADDVIVTGGRKVAPSAVEATLSRVSSVAEVVVVGVPDEEWGARVVAAVVAADATAPPTLAQLRDAMAGAAERADAPRQLLLLERLPLRGPGKPDRAAIAAIARRAAPGTTTAR